MLPPGAKPLPPVKPTPPPLDSLPEQLNWSNQDDCRQSVSQRPSLQSSSQRPGLELPQSPEERTSYDDVQIQLPPQPFNFTPRVTLPPHSPLPEDPEDLYADNDLFESFQGYLPNVTRKEAEKILSEYNLPHCYLVRDSVKEAKYPHALSIKVPGMTIQHMRIGLRSTGYYSIGEEKPNEQQFDNIQAMVDFHCTQPIKIGRTEIILTNPISNIPNLWK